MTLVVPDTIQIAIEMTASGQQIFNIIGLRTNLISAGDSPSTTLGLVKTAWEQANGPLKKHSNQVTMVGYHYTNLTSTTGATAYLGSTEAGGLAGTFNSMAACAVVKLSGGTRARSEHGRLFHGPLLQSDVNADGRTIAAGTITALQTAYGLFKSNMGGVGYGWAVISRKNSTSKDISDIGVAGILGIQRRRIR